jgi:hypothetical protein
MEANDANGCELDIFAQTVVFRRRWSMTMRRVSNGCGPRYNVLELLLLIGILRILGVLMRLACALPSYLVWRRRRSNRVVDWSRGHRAEHSLAGKDRAAEISHHSNS